MNQNTQIALVTGASSGIGSATAKLLAESGFRVIGAGRNVEALETLCAALGDQFFPLALDVNDWDSVSTLFDRLPMEYHQIDVLVNNAGHDIGGRRRFDEGDVEQWVNIIETNISGVVRVTKLIVEGMVARGAGHVVNMGSVAGLHGYASGAMYSASKHAIHGFSESLRLDYVGSGIRVTEILPGLVKTQFAANRFSYASDNEEKAEEFYQSAGKWLIPEDIARSIVFALQQPENVTISQLVVVPS
ncbi:MAG: SDR family NAD(P)-dependent oxidoreductase [Gammaproteobacteria bacterium]|nr:SDR family NAD(P)-dependent oxidoreductase [Gammaproteobacteria bacterium]